MKLALLSDLHANRHALQACLAHARQAGAERFAVLGDIVGYGAHPAEVVDAVMQLAEQGAWVLRGNHDHYAVAPPATVVNEGERGARWTHEQLSEGQRKFLAGLPLLHFQRDAGLLLVHASAEAPERWRYVDNPHVAAQSLDGATALDAAVRHVFGGHVHQQTLYFRSPVGKLMPFVPTAGVPVPVPPHRHWLATVGSVGQPRDGNPRAMYALFDTERHLLVFHRVAYDHAAASEAIRRTDLPAVYADRLLVGR